MKRTYSIYIGVLLVTSVFSELNAGNKDRSGQAGATELIINPWARSSGWVGANTASIRGLESMRYNVAGLAFTPKTEVIIARTSWWTNPFSKNAVNADIFINSFGFSQRIGDASVLGAELMSVDFGDISVTTVDQPEGGIGTYSPQFINVGIAYAREFSNSIYGGLTLRIVSESIADAKAQGIALDAGIQYVAGANKQAKFGIALRNVAPPMKYSGDGLSFRGIVSGTDDVRAFSHRSEFFELPSLLNIGAAYDFILVPDMHKLNIASNFTANSFTKDQLGVGVEYGFKTYFMFRVGYNYEKGILDKELRENAYSGPSVGFTFEVPFGQSGTTMGLDYSFRVADPFQNTHSLGIRVNL